MVSGLVISFWNTENLCQDFTFRISWWFKYQNIESIITSIPLLSMGIDKKKYVLVEVYGLWYKVFFNFM